MRFSERMGIVPVRKIIQIDSVDEVLRNKLWNGVDIFVLEELREEKFVKYSENRHLFMAIWHDLFGRRIDTIPDFYNDCINELSNIYCCLQWHEVYDFIEFIASELDDQSKSDHFIQFCNGILESEMSGYRFVGIKIVPITTPEELSEIEQAIGQEDAFSSVSTHIQTALRHLSDRQNPDFRNSIKESISAVEAICQIITGDRKAVLSQALKKLDQSLQLHPALKASFEKLYAYTSDAEGIRHALLDESNLTFDDAKYMLVCCSAFVNYLKSKAASSGISV